MVNANIDIFEVSHEESVSYCKRLENLEKIRCTNGPNPSSLPVDYTRTELLPVVYPSLQRIIRVPTCGVTIVTRTTTTLLISEQSPNLNSRKRTRLALKLKLDPKRSLSIFFLFEGNNALKRQLKPEKTASSKKRNKEG
jgi:hypothetical protein